MPHRAYLDNYRKFGVEIEAYGREREDVAFLLSRVGLFADAETNFHEDKLEWTVSADGTIDQPLPLEIISPPLVGMQGIRQVGRVLYTLGQMGVKVNESCALHVHWSVTDFSGIHLINLLKLYAKFEPVIDYFVSEDRRGDTHQHCRSLIKKNSWAWVDEMQSAYHSRAYEVARKFEETQRLYPVTSFPSARHHKVNPCAVNKYGTVEFRQHHSTLDFESVQNWILLTGQMVHRAKSTEIKEGDISLLSFFKTLSLTNTQLSWFSKMDDGLILAEMRDFYRRKYRRKKNGKPCIQEV